MNTGEPTVSIVVPIFNEEASIQELYSRVVTTLENENINFELIAVDDGSTDNTLSILRELRARDERLRILRLTRNFGQNPALYAGFSKSRGEYVVMLDADLQNYPEDIPKLLIELDVGYDIVSGWRMDRHDSAFRRWTSKLLNIWVSKITKLELNDYGCALKAFRREVVDRMNQLTHRCRYLPADFAMLGGKVTEVVVRHDQRRHGQSKYNTLKLARTALDLIASITLAPLHIIGGTGIIFVASGALLGAWAAYKGFLLGTSPIISSVLATVIIIGGVQLICLGLACEYIGRIYTEAQRKPYFVIQEEMD